MGTFMGHVLPGSFFLGFSLWWTIQVFRRYYESRRKSGAPFRATTTFPCTCLCGRWKDWEWEGFFKLFFTGVGFTGEIITAFHGGRFAYLGNGQHATMFFFFGLSGVVDIMVHHKVPLPTGVEYLILTLAVSVEAVLFKFHLHGRTDMDIQLHTLLLYTIYANILTVLAEMRFRTSLLAVLARAYFTMLQGTWFCQAAFVLYNPLPDAKPWDQEDHEQMMVVAMIYAWHMGGCFVVMLLIGLSIGCCYRMQGELINDAYDSYKRLKMNLVKKDEQGQLVVNDTDSDLEFEQPRVLIQN